MCVRACVQRLSSSFSFDLDFDCFLCSTREHSFHLSETLRSGEKPSFLQFLESSQLKGYTLKTGTNVEIASEGKVTEFRVGRTDLFFAESNFAGFWRGFFSLLI